MMNTHYYISPRTHNSLFATLVHPQLRFLLLDKVALHTQHDLEDVAATVYINLYDAVTDALGDEHLWERLGFDYNNLILCRQSMHNLGEHIYSPKSDITLLHIKRFCLFINQMLGVLDLLFNTPEQEEITFQLTTTENFQSMFSELLAMCHKSEIGARKLGMEYIPGCKKPMLLNSVNVIGKSEIEELAGFLKMPENQKMVTDIYINCIGALPHKVLCSINPKGFIEAFTRGRQIEEEAMVKLYLAHQNIAFVNRVDYQEDLDNGYN